MSIMQRKAVSMALAALVVGGCGFVLLGLLFSDQAQSQTTSNRLSGVKEISFLIERDDDDANECRITEDLIRDAFMYPLSGGRFAVKERPVLDVPYMYISIPTMFFKQRQHCVWHILMQLGVPQGVTLTASGRTVFAKVELWHERFMMSSALKDYAGQDHARRVREAIEEMTKKFITDWDLDNK
jgi:hypothetical protein